MFYKIILFLFLKKKKKKTLFILNNIIDSFKSNTITTNFFTTFIQTVEVVNFYCFASEFICNFSIFLNLKGIKNFINQKFKTKYTSPKKLVQQQKLPIIAENNLKFLNKIILFLLNSKHTHKKQ